MLASGRRTAALMRSSHSASTDSSDGVPAAPSPDSEAGSFRGVFAAARKHLSTGFIAGDVEHPAWTESPDRQLAGRTLHLRGVDVLAFGGYARHGEYHELAAAVARATRNGKLPFIWLADFNTVTEHGI